MSIQKLKNNNIRLTKTLLLFVNSHWQARSVWIVAQYQCLHSFLPVGYLFLLHPLGWSRATRNKHFSTFSPAVASFDVRYNLKSHPPLATTGWTNILHLWLFIIPPLNNDSYFESHKPDLLFLFQSVAWLVRDSTTTLVCSQADQTNIGLYPCVRGEVWGKWWVEIY